MQEWYPEYHSLVVMAGNSTDTLMLQAAEKIQRLEAALDALEAATGVKRSSPAVQTAIKKALGSDPASAGREAAGRQPGDLISKLHASHPGVAKRREAAAAEEAELAKRREEVRKNISGAGGWDAEREELLRKRRERS
jgi:hypothetical protein